MKQRRIVTVVAIIAVTGAVSVPNSLAMAWRLDISDRHVIDRGGLKWNPLIHTVDDTDGLPSHEPEYQTLGHPSMGPSPSQIVIQRRTPSVAIQATTSLVRSATKVYMASPLLTITFKKIHLDPRIRPTVGLVMGEPRRLRVRIP